MAKFVMKHNDHTVMAFTDDELYVISQLTNKSSSLIRIMCMLSESDLTELDLAKRFDYAPARWRSLFLIVDEESTPDWQIWNAIKGIDDLLEEAE